MSSETIDRIITSAENQARSGLYNAFSFREIAKDIGIKSASIHYHFPTKADLASELVRRYTEKFNGYLQAISDSSNSTKQQLSDYAALLYHALTVDQKMCLCGMFAAEIDVLPDNVKISTRLFFEAQIQWLSILLTNHGIDDAESEAMKLLANMEGAMLLARAFDSEEYFTRAVDLSAYQ